VVKAEHDLPGIEVGKGEKMGEGGGGRNDPMYADVNK
jgi:hypothetical protein